MTKVILLFVVVLGLEIAVLAGSEDEPATLEGKLQKEIKDANLLADEMDATYNPDNKALIVDLFQETYWDESNLKDTMYMDTADVLEVVSCHPTEIETVVIEYQTMLVDKNYNDVRERVYLATYLTNNTNPVNWANVYADDRGNALQKNAESFWLHPAIK